MEIENRKPVQQQATGAQAQSLKPEPQKTKPRRAPGKEWNRLLEAALHCELDTDSGHEPSKRWLELGFELSV